MIKPAVNRFPACLIVIVRPIQRQNAPYVTQLARRSDDKSYISLDGRAFHRRRRLRPIPRRRHQDPADAGAPRRRDFHIRVFHHRKPGMFSHPQPPCIVWLYTAITTGASRALLPAAAIHRPQHIRLRPAARFARHRQPLLVTSRPAATPENPAPGCCPTRLQSHQRYAPKLIRRIVRRKTAVERMERPPRRRSLERKCVSLYPTNVMPANAIIIPCRAKLMHRAAVLLLVESSSRPCHPNAHADAGWLETARPLPTGRYKFPAR